MPERSKGRFSREDEGHAGLDALARVGAAAQRAVNREDLLGVVLSAVGEALPGCATGVAEVNDGDVRIPQRLIRGRMPIEPATLVAALAIDRAEPVERVDGEGVALAMPLLARLQAEGSLVVTAHRTRLTDADRQMLHAMASLLAIALDNLRLHRKVEGLLFRR